MTTTMPRTLHCLRCEATWLPRLPVPPLCCPRCHSRLWQTPKREPKAAKPIFASSTGALTSKPEAPDSPIVGFHAPLDADSTAHATQDHDFVSWAGSGSEFCMRCEAPRATAGRYCKP